RSHRHERAAYVRVLDDRHHFLTIAHPAALAAIGGICGGLLRSALSQSYALDADRQPRLVHHDEHGREAAVLLADEVADSAPVLAVLQHAGRARVDAELVLQAGADDVIALAQRAVWVHQALRHEEQRDSLGSGRSI